MEELLQRLETKIKEKLHDLSNQCDQLKTSNQQLHQYKSVLAREKELLLEKQQKAIAQIEILVSKLKAIEKTP